MDAERKVWRKPTVDEISVSKVLGMGPAQGPALGPPGWASPGPLITGAESSMPGTILQTMWTDGPPVPVSDVRLKEDLKPVGTTVHGLPLYTFRYRGQQGIYEGVMAQDVIGVRPDAVLTGPDGFYRVDYAKLGIECRRIA